MIDIEKAGELVNRLQATSEGGLFDAMDSGIYASPAEAAECIISLSSRVSELEEALRKIRKQLRTPPEVIGLANDALGDA